jgi:hypothetical protein
MFLPPPHHPGGVLMVDFIVASEQGQPLGTRELWDTTQCSSLYYNGLDNISINHAVDRIASAHGATKEASDVSDFNY